MRYYQKSILASNTLEELKLAVAYRHSNLISSQKDFNTNSLGFRDKEILDKVDICYYGCSITYGLGVDIDCRWTNLIDDSIGTRSNNFGVPGASIEDIAQLFITTTKLISMDTAVFLLPDVLRSTLPIAHNNDFTYSKIYSHYQTVYQKGSDEYKLCDLYFKIPESVHVDKMRAYVEIIINWAKLKNINLVLASWAYETLSLLNNICHDDIKLLRNQMLLDNNGSDGLHPGIESHKKLAGDIVKVINNEL